MLHLTPCRSDFFNSDKQDYKTKQDKKPAWLIKLTGVMKRNYKKGKRGAKLESVVGKVAETLLVFGCLIVFAGLPLFL